MTLRPHPPRLVPCVGDLTNGSILNVPLDEQPYRPLVLLHHLVFPYSLEVHPSSKLELEIRVAR
jgi:hypothetical protein